MLRMHKSRSLPKSSRYDHEDAVQPSHTCCQGHTAVGSALQVKNVTTRSVGMFVLLTDCDITITIQTKMRLTSTS